MAFRALWRPQRSLALTAQLPALSAGALGLETAVNGVLGIHFLPVTFHFISGHQAPHWIVFNLRPLEEGLRGRAQPHALLTILLDMLILLVT